MHTQLMHTVVGQQQIKGHLNWTYEISNVSVHLLRKTNYFLLTVTVLGGGVRARRHMVTLSQGLYLNNYKLKRVKSPIRKM